MKTTQEPAGRSLSGAQMLATLLAAHGFRTVYAYPGTSELAMCDAIAASESLTLVNARGDREAVFMAAGGNLSGTHRCAAVLHGARGLTNALGAIADARRSEHPVLCLVGMASTASQPYLPPHAEADLMASASAFAKATFDCSELDADQPEQLLKVLTAAMAALDEKPAGPVLLGLPQDLLSAAFVPTSTLLEALREMPENATSLPDLTPAIRLLTSARTPVILVDDYALLAGNRVQQTVAELSTALDAPVLQVAYRRGPMLFQQISPTVVGNFAGLYDPQEPEHGKIMQAADLLITVDDRNMYPRVVGSLPGCPKIAITCNPRSTAKNGYLADTDLVLTGDVGTILHHIAAGAGRPGSSLAAPAVRRAPDDTGSSAQTLVKTLGTVLGHAGIDALVDDSQMFGGLIAKNYHYLPAGLRVFGSHGGFVGAGLATAAGLASANTATAVACTLGDQGYTNGVQALAMIGEHQVPLLMIVCNNGSSVSLRKQARHDGLAEGSAASSILGNNGRMQYGAVAEGYGVATSVVSWPPAGASTQELATAAGLLTSAVGEAVRERRPHLIELLVSDAPEFWAGVWNVEGFESKESDHR